MGAHEHPLPTVAILYGIGEGQRIGKKFCDYLKAHGFMPTTDLENADIILAHSAGVLALPVRLTGKTILIVGPSIGWQGSILAALHQKIALDLRTARAKRYLLSFLKRSTHNIVYLLRQSPTFKARWRIAETHRNKLPILEQCRVGIILLKGDPISSLFTKLNWHQAAYTFIHLNHLHDDLWDHPEDYVNILRYLHESADISPGSR